MKVTVSADLMQRIAIYLSQRPFREVAGLISEIQSELAKQQNPDSEVKS